MAENPSETISHSTSQIPKSPTWVREFNQEIIFLYLSYNKDGNSMLVTYHLFE
jgi:hypothetical protein